MTETYISLRKLENKVLEEKIAISGTTGTTIQVSFGDTNYNPIKVSIDQFYGIEINDFAVSVARTALWIAESQMLIETENIINMSLDFFPLTNYPNIVEGNALRIDWEDIVPKNELNYIMGNPPFVGGMMMSAEQTLDLKKVMSDIQKTGEMDFVTGWFYKASEYMNLNPKVRTAFVSTNSLCQGQ